ncbi:Hsp33 family molecular chaperone HslO [Aliidiomarina maris]|uniref:Hsp33 family molecular chaperone HslO n=1 Tax=Aliidiomarina maris TaxID=531312 RepID=A0A327X5Q0_9GAMM|nr:Hsp33 family molecular chaperone HslO [Aliidiomarina maris]RAK00674.1 molecular chaperone Hsp33 [Aliidiomarina maris]RUO27319.1 Hsp33 family molecular chaperone HslO [Aliidiomarina maris]
MQSADSLIRYTFANVPVRGELVQLEQSYQGLVEGHHYPKLVRHLLGELMAVTSLLSATLKFDGHINLQIQGNGKLNFATVNGSQQQQLRGVARLTSDVNDSDSFASLVGDKAYLIITLSPEDKERYQGMVEVKATDGSLSQVIERYFTQSEQLRTRVWLHANDQQVAGMLLQALPGEDDPAHGFDHLATLTETITADELFNLEANVVLHRLYHEDDVLVYDPMAVAFFCGCSRERSMNALYSVPVDELRDIIQSDGEIKLTCDYCLTEYRYDESDLGALQGHSNEQLQ